MLKKILFIFLFCLLYFFSADKSIAATILNEDFNDFNSSWKYRIFPGNNVLFNNGVMELSSDSQIKSFPYIEGDISNYLSSDYTLKLKFKFGDFNVSGTGFGIGHTGIDKTNFFQFGIWADYNNGIYFFYNDFNNTNGGFCNNILEANDLSNRIYKRLPLFKSNEWHEMEIVSINNKNYVYFDKDKK